MSRLTVLDRWIGLYCCPQSPVGARSLTVTTPRLSFPTVLLSPYISSPHFIYVEYVSSYVARESHYATTDTTQVNSKMQF